MKRKKLAPAKQTTKTASVVDIEWARLIQMKFRHVFQTLNSTLSNDQLSSLDAMAFEAVLSATIDPKNLWINALQTARVSRSKSLTLKNKKILFVSGMFPDVKHGGGLRVFDLMDELVRSGYEVYLFSPSPGAHESYSKNRLAKILTGTNYVDYNDFNLDSLQSWLKKTDIQFQSAYYVWPQATTLIGDNSKYIGSHIFEYIEVTIRRVWMDLELYFQNRQFEKIPEKLIELWTCFFFEQRAAHLADHLICVTEKDADFIEKAFGRKSTVIPTCISRSEIWDRKKKSTPPKPGLVGFLGNYDHYPNKDGIDWYLDTIHPIVLGKFPDYRLNVMGVGNLKDLQLKHRSYKKSVIWAGQVDDIIPALQQNEICISPLISGAGIRGKINQYAVAERPIVTTTIGNCGTNYQNEESVFEANAPEEFAQRVCDLLESSSLRKHMSRNALKLVESEFRWDGPIKNLIKLL